jgi:GNAT superfamily N-acetyltransferase
MNFREATIKDTKALQVIRHAVKENRLSNPLLVTDADVINYLTVRGKGWVCEVNKTIVGFAIADAVENNIWALFIDPNYEKKGIGRKLQAIMLNWFFDQSNKTLWLGTAPDTRAESFYTASGWKNMGLQKNGEIRFEMTYEDWKNKNKEP